MLYSLLIVALASTVSAGALPRQSGRIIGGEPTTIETYPYMVSIQYRNEHECGGAIISSHYIITAAHCADPSLAQKIRAGSTYKTKGGSVHQITKIHIHEKFGGNEHNSMINDIAIMRVKEPFVFDDTRQPIKLFEAGEEALPGLMSVVTGWGDLEDNSRPIQLYTVSLPIVSKKVCNAAYVHWGGLPEGQICAGYYGVGGKDTCVGDSGGPLAINGRLAGIVSYGEDCALPEFPGIYTEIAAFRDWINKTVKLE